MNRKDFLSALRQALSGLPDEERANALRYYEEYFDDAGPENEESAAAGLGNPADVARQILADYRELITHPQGANAGASGASGAPGAQSVPQGDGTATPRHGWRGINPWLLLVLVIFAIPIGVPLFIGLLTVLAGIVVTLLALILTVVIVVLVVPIALCGAGIGLAVISLFLWGMPASAVVTFGVGLMSLALGVLLGMLFIKLCRLFVPPLVRGVIAILRWPFKLFNKGRNL